jgi:hypothetical protein
MAFIRLFGEAQNSRYADKYLPMLRQVFPHKGQSMSMSNLEKALDELLKSAELTSRLASVLVQASKRGSISYREVDKIVHDNAEDILLLGNEWRVLLPVRTVKSGAWEDRLLLCKPGESYEVPNIVRLLVVEATKTGRWNTERAITNIFKEMGEPAWEIMPKLVERLEEQARDYRVTASQIKKICSDLDLGDRVDALIAGLKAGGVMSPKLGSIAEVSREGTPIYELNPSLFIKKGQTAPGS